MRAIALKRRAPRFGPRSAIASPVNAVAAVATPIVLTVASVPVTGAPRLAERGKAQPAFPDLLGELVGSINSRSLAPEPQAESVPQPHEARVRAGSRDRGDGEAPKGRKPERLTASSDGAAIDLVHELASAPRAIPLPPPLLAIGGTTVDGSGLPGPAHTPADTSCAPSAEVEPLPVEKTMTPGAVPVLVEVAVAIAAPVTKTGKASAPIPMFSKVRAATENVESVSIVPTAHLQATAAPPDEPRHNSGVSGVREAVSQTRDTTRTDGTSHRDPPVETPARKAEPSMGRTNVAPPMSPEEQAQGDPGAVSTAAGPVGETPPAPLAFAARLAPSAGAMPPTVAAAPVPPQPPAAPDPPAAPAHVMEAEPDAHPVERVRKPEATAETDRDPSPDRQDVAVNAPVRTTAMGTETPPPEAPRPETRQAEPKAPRPAEPMHPAAVHPPAAEPTVRDIRLELAGPGQKVEVRLEERAGEVRVSVRTPDGALAETLRDHLPALSARLEQSGIRADQWRAADGPGETRSIEVPRAAGSGASEGRQHQPGSGGEQSPRQQPGRQREPRGENQTNRNQKGKSFAWLMSSLE
jgi:hypothetical protein